MCSRHSEAPCYSTWLLFHGICPRSNSTDISEKALADECQLVRCESFKPEQMNPHLRSTVGKHHVIPLAESLGVSRAAEESVCQFEHYPVITAGHATTRQISKERPGMKAGCSSPSGGHTRVVTKGESSPSTSSITYDPDFPMSQKYKTDVKHTNKSASR